MFAGSIRAALILSSALALAACIAPPSLPPAAEQAPPAFPDASYRLARPVLTVDAQQSLITIGVGRAGALARLGHDHLVACRELHGYVAPEEGRADFWLSLERLTVDEPELRRLAGLETQPSREAVEGTRRNMLDKVLEAERFPFVLIAARSLGRGKLKLSITLHGITREWEVPVIEEAFPDGLAISGRMAFNQSDFGIAPFAVLGGALQVRDRLEVNFRVVARKS